MTIGTLQNRRQSTFRAGRLVPALLTGMALLVTACADETPTGIVAPRDAARSTSAAETSVLVGFTAMPGTAEVSMIEGLGGRVTTRYKYIPVVAAAIPEGQEDVLRAVAGVTFVEANLPIYPLGGRQITDYGISKVEAPAAWALGYRGQGARVGIFDSGIDIDHPDLAVAGGIDLVGDGNGLDDCQGHGTHVAGIVGARNNGNHTVGVAPGAALYSMRLADCNWGGGTVEKMIAGLEWAIDNQMDVVNMSFGFGEGIDGVAVVSTPTSPSEAADLAFTAAYQRGVLLVAASGNSSTPYVGYPAAHKDVIAVGATDDADMLASFSQFGADQELTAPGVNNLASYLVGQGIDTKLTVDTDSDRELETIALLFAGQTRKSGLSVATVYAGLGTPVEFQSVQCTGRTVLVIRGGLSFAEKTVNAMNAGCAAIIIGNNQPGNFNGTLGTATAPDGRPWIPAVSITLEDGLYLKNQIETKSTVTTLVNAPGNLAMLSGTSMASPHAAGVAALVIGKNPTLTPDQVRAILRSSSDDLGAPGWDPVFGHGRVNARKAVQN